MRTAEEIDQQKADYERMAGINILSFDNIQQLGNLAKIIFIDGYTKALEWVKTEGDNNV